jgi:rhodanese-related sulfurtransferase
VGGDALASLPPAQVRSSVAEGAVVVDVRPIQRFSEQHVRASVSIPLRDAFATWLGWLLDPEASVVIVRDADQDPAEVLWQARKIGFDTIIGELAGGVPAWAAAGEATASIPLVDAGALAGQHVLDVRQDSEFASGHLPQAEHIELGQLPGHVSDLPTGPTVVMCGHGERAMGAASLLERDGRSEVAVLSGSPRDWARTTGHNLAAGR